MLLAPAPDWVAVDMATGALLRSRLVEAEPPGLLTTGAPLAPVSIDLAPVAEAWDPSRPEAVAVADVREIRSPSRRSQHRLLTEIAGPYGGGGLLGGVGPSLPFVELRGDRPSVCVVAPAGGRVRVVGDEPMVAHFRTGQQSHTLPLAEGASRWLKAGEIPTASSHVAASHRGRRLRGGERLGPGLEPTISVLLVVGLGEPVMGQVRKLVLGVVPAI
jgi:hypothetical protein